MASYAENVSIWWRHHDKTIIQINDDPVHSRVYVTGPKIAHFDMDLFYWAISNQSKLS